MKMRFSFVAFFSARKRKKIKVSSPPSKNRRKVFTDVFKIYGPTGLVFRTGFTTCGADKKASTTTVSTPRRGSQHGFRGVSMAIMPNMTGYDRRYKSVGGGSEVGRGVSERSRRRCFEGRRGGRKHIDSTSKTGTTGSVGISHHRCFHGLFKIKGSCSPGNSNIMTLTSVRGIFSTPRRREHNAPMTASPRRHDSTFGQLASDTHRPGRGRGRGGDCW